MRNPTYLSLSKFERFFFTNLLKPFTKKINQKISASIPKYELAYKHVQHAKILASREELLRLLPSGGIVAELGVDQGFFSESILEINNPAKLHLVDFWGTKRYNQLKREGVERKFQKQIASRNVEINLGYSTDVVNQFPDKYFDWIYIDTTHSYQLTIAELEAYQPKMKPGGIIAGHDYIIGNWDGVVRYGVIEAVFEFCVKYDWEVLYVTSELKTNPSFALRKI